MSGMRPGESELWRERPDPMPRPSPGDPFHVSTWTVPSAYLVITTERALLEGPGGAVVQELEIRPDTLGVLVRVSGSSYSNTEEGMTDGSSVHTGVLRIVNPGGEALESGEMTAPDAALAAVKQAVDLARRRDVRGRRPPADSPATPSPRPASLRCPYCSAQFAAVRPATCPRCGERC
jgi:hypothetical protein